MKEIRTLALVGVALLTIAVAPSARAAQAVKVASATAASPARMGPPGRLTLARAVHEALATSWSLKGSREDVREARERIRQADGSFAPQISLGVTPLRLGLLNPPDLSGILQAFAPGLNADFSPDLISETVTVSQVLYDGGKIGLGQQAARMGADLARTRRRMVAQNVALETADAYLGALRAKEVLLATTWGVKQAERHIADAELRYRQGAGTEFDVLQAQSAKAEAQTRQLLADDAVKTSRLALGTLIHHNLDRLKLDPLPVLPEVVVRRTGMEQGVAARPEVRALEDQVDLARDAAQIQQRDLLPTAGVEGIFGQAAAGPTRFYVVLGSLSWTVFDGGRTQSEIAQKEIAVKSSKDKLLAVEDGLRLDVDRALIDRHEAKRRMTLSESGMEAAQGAYRLAKLRFKEGAGTGTEVIDATTAVVGAKTAYIQAMYDELAAEVSLARAVGIDLPTLLTARE